MSITVIVLAKNEAKHIQRCLKSVRNVATRTVVVDSLSTDETVQLAEANGADVFVHEWKNYSSQFNWALENISIDTPWILRLDADEIVTPELGKAIRERLPTIPSQVSGVTVNRMIKFMGRPIRYGGVYPGKMLRIWRTGEGHCEERWMDEHIVVAGDITHFDSDIIDDNLNNLTWWTEKHNNYANREAIDILMRSVDDNVTNASHGMSKQARVKRWMKNTLYRRLPLGLRSFGYFVARYFVLLGFLDGRRGAMFHFLQGFWYRFLVDCKVYELQLLMQSRGCSLTEIAKDEFGFDLSSSP